jgi:hypothetical protein
MFPQLARRKQEYVAEKVWEYSRASEDGGFSLAEVRVESAAQ